MMDKWRGARRAYGVLAPTKWRNRLGFAAAGVLVASLGVAVPAAAQAAPAALPLVAAPAAPSQVDGQAASGGQVRSVTLLTGDRVQVPADGGPVTVTPGEGRERVSISVTNEREHLVVVPDDAYQLLVEGKLDKRLFDVTTLIDFGYDDAGRGDLPLLVSGALPGARRAALAGAGAAVVRELRSIGGVTLRPSKKEASRLWAALTADRAGARAGERALAAGVDKVWLDGRRKVALDVSVPQIGAPAAHQAGFDGTGVKVAVLDTGIDASHPDLAGKVVAAQDFTGEGLPTQDPFGHGTHVASIVGGSGAASSGQFTGVAYDAMLAYQSGADQAAALIGSASLEDTTSITIPGALPATPGDADVLNANAMQMALLFNQMCNTAPANDPGLLGFVPIETDACAKNWDEVAQLQLQVA